ncbi:MAG: TIGR00282 family metallophosphoesterase [Kiritimatiellae bacterium]|jgi:metallophosphoesterase (TIGR00282 family)|nr:TIGR00282 family metallophosphoesterase [Kiritimatiellia bacterium]HHU15996.1 TIGR00282 family metallophosphoesterase [Lentisphaerota bacterium]HON47291.1 TIGR00282 family metallophosphoesterase [Kiritimatiellia bacterium]
MKVLLVGDVVGSPGRRVFREVVKRLRAESAVHAVVVNAENAAAGSGITMALAQEIFAAGADVITMGDHAWGQRDLENTIGGEKRLIRPVNSPPGTPGQGSVTVQTALGPLTVVSLLGRVFMNPTDCPFRAMDALLNTLPRNVPIIVDFHAEATSEKIAMGHHLDGRVAAVVGTHTHVQTSDAVLLPKGTAYMTDLGMTGPAYSVIGREIAPVLRKFTTGMPSRFEVASGLCVLEGAVLELDRATGRALSITAYRYRETSEADQTPPGKGA